MEQPLSVLPSSAASPTAVLALVAVVAIVAVNHLVASRRSTPELSRRRRRRRLPPGPASLPVIGHLHLLRLPVHRTFHELAARYGPLMRIRLGSTNCVVVTSAEVAAELFRGHEAAVSGRPLAAVSRQFGYGAAGIVFSPCTPYWRFMRRLCMSELLGPRTVEQLRPVRDAGVAALLRAARAAAAAGGEVNLTREIVRLSNTAIVRMMARDAPEGVTEEAQELVKDVTELSGAFNLDDHIALCRGWDLQGLRRSAAAVHRRFDALLEEMIRHKKEARKRTAGGAAVKQHQKDTTAAAVATGEGSRDLLDILLDKAEDETAEVKLTMDNIKAFMIDMVTAGSDTAAATVEWMLAELINHPDAMRKVREEIDAAVGGGRVVGEADLPRLPYLQAAYKETLRLHPAVPVVPRESAGEEFAVRGFAVPPRTVVFLHVWAMGRDPASWEDAAAFAPERFMPGGAAAGVEPRGQSFQFLPFGAGRRTCPGMGLALQSVPAVLAALVQCFDWATGAGDGDGDGAVDMEEGHGLVCARKHPLVLRPAVRLSPFPAVA
ncbi:hypothetical protein ACP4OV_025375 [Aristida adscensionis]